MSLIRMAAEMIFPPCCSICGRTADTVGRLGFDLPDGVSLCFECMSSIVPFDKDRRWTLCLSEPYDQDPIKGLRLYIPYAYDGFFSRAVPAVKFSKKEGLACFLGRLLGEMLKEDNVTADLIVPVPLSAGRLKERGFNQAFLIAREAGKVLSVPVGEDVLIRRKDTKRQTELRDNFQRSRNVEKAFILNPEWDIEGLRLILVDDVSTTGNTLHEAAMVLKDHGAFPMCACVCGNRNVKNAESF